MEISKDPSGTPRIEIWIRQTGSRRQAFYRPVGSTAPSWQAMQVMLADKALRAGKFTSGPLAGTAVVPRETQADPLAARRVEFAAEAVALNRAMDSITAGTAA